MNSSRTMYGMFMLVALIALTLLLTTALGGAAPADVAQAQPDAGLVFHSAAPLADQVALRPNPGKPGNPCPCAPPVPPTN